MSYRFPHPWCLKSTQGIIDFQPSCHSIGWDISRPKTLHVSLNASCKLWIVPLLCGFVLACLRHNVPKLKESFLNAMGPVRPHGWNTGASCVCNLTCLINNCDLKKLSRHVHHSDIIRSQWYTIKMVGKLPTTSNLQFHKCHILSICRPLLWQKGHLWITFPPNPDGMYVIRDIRMDIPFSCTKCILINTHTCFEYKSKL